MYFTNRDGHKLAARLEFPVDKAPAGFAVFAHCFTCNKNYHAPRNISADLAGQGYGVLSFDFTGLGDSEGEFADTSFSSTVEDLVDAARFLEAEYQQPSLLVGHSLGGAAAIVASDRLPSIAGVVTLARTFHERCRLVSAW
jgi:putative redox protein